MTCSAMSQQMEENKSLEKVFQDSLGQGNLKRKHVLADLYVQILCLLAYTYCKGPQCFNRMWVKLLRQCKEMSAMKWLPKSRMIPTAYNSACFNICMNLCITSWYYAWIYVSPRLHEIIVFLIFFTKNQAGLFLNIFFLQTRVSIYYTFCAVRV